MSNGNLVEQEQPLRFPDLPALWQDSFLRGFIEHDLLIEDFTHRPDRAILFNRAMGLYLDALRRGFPELHQVLQSENGLTYPNRLPSLDKERLGERIFLTYKERSAMISYELSPAKEHPDEMDIILFEQHLASFPDPINRTGPIDLSEERPLLNEALQLGRSEQRKLANEYTQSVRTIKTILDEAKPTLPFAPSVVAEWNSLAEEEEHRTHDVLGEKNALIEKLIGDPNAFKTVQKLQARAEAVRMIHTKFFLQREMGATKNTGLFEFRKIAEQNRGPYLNGLSVTMLMLESDQEDLSILRCPAVSPLQIAEAHNFLLALAAAPEQERNGTRIKNSRLFIAGQLTSHASALRSLFSDVGIDEAIGLEYITHVCDTYADTTERGIFAAIGAAEHPVVDITNTDFRYGLVQHFLLQTEGRPAAPQKDQSIEEIWEELKLAKEIPFDRIAALPSPQRVALFSQLFDNPSTGPADIGIAFRLSHEMMVRYRNTKFGFTTGWQNSKLYQDVPKHELLRDFFEAWEREGRRKNRVVKNLGQRLAFDTSIAAILNEDRDLHKFPADLEKYGTELLRLLVQNDRISSLGRLYKTDLTKLTKKYVPTIDAVARVYAHIGLRSISMGRSRIANMDDLLEEAVSYGEAALTKHMAAIKKTGSLTNSAAVAYMERISLGQLERAITEKILPQIQSLSHKTQISDESLRLALGRTVRRLSKPTGARPHGGKDTRTESSEESPSDE